jgi:O-antigen/teichoic acid export membrane protein
MFIAVPIMVGFIALGKEFVWLWMGQGYEQSAPILSILAISHLGAMASFPCFQALMGAGRVKLVAFITITEGIMNLCLSVFFVMVCKLGIVGVALGTLIPMIGFTGVIVAICTCRAFKIKLSEFTKVTHFRWLQTAVIFTLPCVAAAHLPISPSWPLFFAKIISLLIVYLPIGFYLLLTKREQNIISNYLKKMLVLCRR